MDQSLRVIDCELGPKMRRKDIIKKIKDCPNEANLELEISCQAVYPQLSNHLVEILSTNPNHVQHLSLIFSGFASTSQTYLTISKCLTKLTSLASLNLEFLETNISDDDLKPILYSVVEAENLIDLSLNISGCSNITTESSTPIGVSIGQLMRLEKFSINIEGCRQLSNEFIERVSKLIRRMVSLKHVCMYVSKSGITSFEFLSILDSIERFSNLELSFAFEQKTDLQQVANVSELAERLLELSTKIRVLNLNLHGSKFAEDPDIRNSETSKLSKAISNLNLLTSFYFNIGESNNTSEIHVLEIYKNLANILSRGVSFCLNVEAQERFQEAKKAAIELHAQTLTSLTLLQRLTKYLFFKQEYILF